VEALGSERVGSERVQGSERVDPVADVPIALGTMQADPVADPLLWDHAG